MARRKLRVLLIAALIVLLVTGIPLGLTYYLKRGIELPAASTFEIGGTPVVAADAEKLRDCLGRLWPKWQGMYEKPDFEILVLEPSGEERWVAIWLGKAFAYDGDYLGAWYERQRGTTTEGFRIDSATRKLLLDLAPPNPPAGPAHP